MDGVFCGHAGKPVVIKNAICIVSLCLVRSGIPPSLTKSYAMQHEEDAGVLWKHTDFRVGGRGHAVRSRKLVVSMVSFESPIAPF